MSKKSQDHQQLTLFVEGSHVRTSVLLDAVQDWMESEAGYGLSSYELLTKLNRNGLLLKTSLVCFPVTQETTRQVTCSLDSDGKLQKKVIYPSSFKGWRNAGIGGPTGFLTLNIGEFPKDAAVCSLSDILETWEDWSMRYPGKQQEDYQAYLQKFYLSPKAARGILRRAEKRGRILPPLLKQALQAVAAEEVAP